MHRTAPLPPTASARPGPTARPRRRASSQRDINVLARGLLRHALSATILVLLVGAAAPLTAADDDPFAAARERMVAQQVIERGVRAPAVLAAMNTVPRHLFVPETERDRVYADQPVEIGRDQTLPQAYISARMIELLDLEPGARVLEIGTGSGYEAALLGQLAAQVYTIEIDEELGQRARSTLAAQGYTNVRVKIGDGYRGWPDAAPFDAILLTAAPETVPKPLLDQLRIGGRMVVAVGNVFQDLKLITKTADGTEAKRVIPVRLAPMEGEIRRQRR
ncbi:MAG: protein-L-isoaspartate(D-aspartate) O-methyltransferase [Acidobacteriota bacterium]